MRILVCGSRSFGKPMVARAVVTRELSKLDADTTTVIHGGADGVDVWADAAAWSFGMQTETWRADWEQYGKRAGILRNIAMLDSEPDLVLAFWNGFSKGTLHTITEARKRGIPTEVIPLEPIE
jgi:hypothetical protein